MRLAIKAAPNDGSRQPFRGIGNVGVWDADSGADLGKVTRRIDIEIPADGLVTARIEAHPQILDLDGVKLDDVRVVHEGLVEADKDEAIKTLGGWGVYMPEKVVQEIEIAGYVLARRQS